MDERTGASKNLPPDKPCDLDALVPPEQRRPWIMWLMEHLDRLVLVFFLTVFVFLVIRYLWRS